MAAANHFAELCKAVNKLVVVSVHRCVLDWRPRPHCMLGCDVSQVPVVTSLITVPQDHVRTRPSAPRCQVEATVVDVWKALKVLPVNWTSMNAPAVAISVITAGPASIPVEATGV